MKYLFVLLTLLVILSCEKKANKKLYNNNENKFYILAKKSKDETTAYKLFNYAKEDFINKKDSLMAGKALINMAIIMSNQGDYYGSLQTSIEARKILLPKDSLHNEVIASNFNCMAIASENLKQYNKSVEYYQKALFYTHDSITKLAYINNIGNSYLQKKDYSKALKYFNSALKNKNVKINKVDYARVINNYAKTKYLINPNYNPIPAYKESLSIREQTNDLSGQNFVLSSFIEFYKDKDIKTAIAYSLKRLAITKKMKNPDDQMETLQQLIILEPSNYLKYFTEYQKINDSTQLARNAAKNQFALIRFEAEEHKVENHRLKIENTEKEIDLLQRNIGLGILSIILIGGIFWYRKRKQRLEQEKELEIKNTQLKISRKVHDVVANGIYQVMTKIENQKNFDKNKALDELEFVYEKSRNISYEEIKLEEEIPFEERVSSLIASFKNDNINTYVAGNSKNIWLGLNATAQDEIYQIIRELLVNMKKHSQANRVVFKFERNDNNIKIQYTDNGIGISGDIIRKNGLTNTGNRIEYLNGEIIFDPQTERGLRINISFPVF
ncbi:ATP-binding protein [Chryseobacterium oryctis]|uniref:histidine kinase n=1 Tax=Chryseobacterium oryctis TaxID=2952618 RepID=A0ABT3HLW8_9FLAO|nr:ATP-binding protein [Chryseobacterium oryctis]MCW3160779.1 hypothetical protein [Chryseobacterium oryctis]